MLKFNTQMFLLQIPCILTYVLNYYAKGCLIRNQVFWSAKRENVGKPCTRQKRSQEHVCCFIGVELGDVWPFTVLSCPNVYTCLYMI